MLAGQQSSNDNYMPLHGDNQDDSTAHQKTMTRDLAALSERTHCPGPGCTSPLRPRDRYCFPSSKRHSISPPSLTLVFASMACTMRIRLIGTRSCLACGD